MVSPDFFSPRSHDPDLSTRDFVKEVVTTFEVASQPSFIIDNNYNIPLAVASTPTIMSKHSYTDTIAEKSAFLQAYMSNHPDTLMAYAK